MEAALKKAADGYFSSPAAFSYSVQEKDDLRADPKYRVVIHNQKRPSSGFPLLLLEKGVRA